MTEDRMALIEAIQKADYGNFLRALAETLRAGRDAYAAEDVPFVAGYATSLGHAFGLHMSGERRYLELERDLKRLRRGHDAPELIGDSEEVGRLRADLHETYLPGTAARPPRPILIVGDTGTGKDLVARYLHYYSPARSAASARVSAITSRCAWLPPKRCAIGRMATRSGIAAA